MKMFVSFLLLISGIFHANAHHKSSEDEILIASLNLIYGTPADLENTWKNRRKRAMALLQEYKEGIICLQEVNETQIHDVSKSISGLSVVYRTQGLKNGEGKANAIFFNKKNWKLISDETFWLSDTPFTPSSKSWGNTLPRLATVVVLENKSSHKRIRVLNTLLDYRSQPSRLKSTELIMKKLQEYPDQYPTLLVGDFNVEPENSVVKNITTAYIDTYRGEKLQGCTYHEFHGGRNCRRIDYVFFRKTDGFEMTDSGIDRFERNKLFPSDHYLVYAKFTLK